MSDSFDSSVETEEEVWTEEHVAAQPAIVEVEHAPPVEAHVLGRAFAEAFNLAAKLSTKKGTMSHEMVVQFQPSQNRVRIMSVGAWAETTANTVCGAVFSGEDELSITIGAAAMLRITPFLPDERVMMRIDPRTSTLGITWPRYRFNLRGSVDEPYPAYVIPEYDEDAVQGSVKMTVADLKSAFVRALPFVSKDDARPTLRSLHASFLEGELTVQATDGFGLIIRKLKEFETVKNLGAGVLLPQGPFPILATSMRDEDEVQIDILASSVVLRTEKIVLRSSIQGGKFPDVSAIVPKERQAVTVTMHTHELRNALKVAKIIGDSPFCDLLVPLVLLERPTDGDVETNVKVTSYGGSNKSSHDLEAVVSYRGAAALATLEDTVDVVVRDDVPYYMLRFNPDLVTQSMGDQWHIALEFDDNRHVVRVVNPDDETGSDALFMPANLLTRK